MRILTPLEKLLFASAIAGFALSTAATGVLPPGYTIPIVDISGETNRQVVVDRESGQYPCGTAAPDLGSPLLEALCR